MSESTSTPDLAHNLKCSRSPPIPKEVNQYVLMNFGADYYNSTDFNSRQELLKNIEFVLNQSGYNITAGGIERRLKNMKSHYRRKKADLEMGTSTKVDWQYYDILHKIFSPSEEMNIGEPSGPNQAQMDPNTPTSIKIPPLPQRRKRRRGRNSAAATTLSAPIDQAAPIIDDSQPQDLTVKKPKLEEPEVPAPDVQNYMNQPLSYLNSFINNQVQANQESYHLILDGLRAINENRTLLSDQIRTLENRRRDLDNLGFELTNLLIVFQRIDASENLGLHN